MLRTISVPTLLMALAGASWAFGCGARSDLPTPAEGGGGQSGGGGEGGDGGSPPDCAVLVWQDAVLRGVVRDFSDAHPDFEEGTIGDDLGIIEARLGDDGLPVYRGGEGTLTTHGREAFDQWFRDVPGVNLGRELTLDLPAQAATQERVFADESFFAIDGELLGNEGREHNFHFTIELHGEFLYQGGEVLRFRGDDDLWVFLNGGLAIDLGGVHGAQTVELPLDLVAGALGMTVGQIYPLDLFFAERHTSGSVFVLSLDAFALCEDER